MGIECSMGSESLFKGHGAKERCIGEYGFLGGQRWVIASEKSADQVPQPEGCYALRCLLQGTTVSTQSDSEHSERFQVPPAHDFPLSLFPPKHIPSELFRFVCSSGQWWGGDSRRAICGAHTFSKGLKFDFSHHG